MAWQADHPDIVGKVFAAKLRADAKLAAGVEQLGFQRRIAECLTQFIPVGGQVIVIFS